MRKSRIREKNGGDARARESERASEIVPRSFCVFRRSRRSVPCEKSLAHSYRWEKIMKIMFDFHILTYAWCNSTSRLFNAGSEGQKRAIDLFLSCMPRARELGVRVVLIFIERDLR